MLKRMIGEQPVDCGGRGDRGASRSVQCIGLEEDDPLTALTLAPPGLRVDGEGAVAESRPEHFLVGFWGFMRDMIAMKVVRDYVTSTSYENMGFH
ncbi:hypothetical protein FH972_015805 [Carpinus fangiana]|uniref:Uncharacterized protein n=1 Tax=Carpinus fangiana TaxID=176857 RepID=A0A5N6RDW6_9ROSI|nr:hypothetical protein FH972_015805 [Carpinus fangiana]